MIIQGSRKRPRQELPYRFRFYGLGAAELFEKKKLQKRLAVICFLIDDQVQAEDPELYNTLELVQVGLLRCLRPLMIETKSVVYPPIDRLPRNLAYFYQHHYDRCEVLFRFRYEYLVRLFRCLNHPADCILENGTHVEGQEVMLFSLCRLTYPDRLHTMSSGLWGKEESEWSRVFKYFNLFIYNTHGFRLKDNFDFWVPYFPAMAEAIQAKLIQLGVQYEEHEQQVIACFLDDTVREICRPGAGPHNRRMDGMNDLQRAFYSGWLGIHALVWQTVDSPYGMIINAWGPGAGRHQDRYRVRESGINEKLRDAQIGNEVQYKMFGDNIFIGKSHLLVRHAGESYILTIRQKQENKARPKVRVSIEWDYTTTCSLFKYVNYKENNKICAGGSNPSLTYFSAMFLKNCHVCLYHSETSLYFGLVPPTLEEYLL